tara:strand:- start:8359 stop:9594 length:1236 start_codon:yes stop_codon:yes gene_type:complete
MPNSRISTHPLLTSQSLDPDNDLIPIVDISNGGNVSKAITPNQLGGAITASHALTASYIENSGGSYKDIGTLQEVMESGSTTSLPITINNSVLAEGITKAVQFENNTNGVINPITTGWAQTASYANNTPNLSTPSQFQETKTTIKICDINSANSIIDGTYDPNNNKYLTSSGDTVACAFSHRRWDYNNSNLLIASPRIRHVTHFQSFYATDNLFASGLIGGGYSSHKRYFKIGLLDSGNFEFDIFLSLYKKTPSTGLWDRLLPISTLSVLPDTTSLFTNNLGPWTHDPVQLSTEDKPVFRYFNEIPTYFSLVKGEKYWLGIQIRLYDLPGLTLNGNWNSGVKFLSHKPNINYFKDNTIPMDYLDDQQFTIYTESNTTTGQIGQTYDLDNPSSFNRMSNLDRICCEIVDIIT